MFERFLEKLSLFAWTVIAVLGASWVAVGFARYLITFSDGGAKPEVIQVYVDGKEAKPVPQHDGRAIRVIGESAGSAAE